MCEADTFHAVKDRMSSSKLQARHMNLCIPIQDDLQCHQDLCQQVYNLGHATVQQKSSKQIQRKLPKGMAHIRHSSCIQWLSVFCALCRCMRLMVLIMACKCMLGRKARPRHRLHYSKSWLQCPPSSSTHWTSSCLATTQAIAASSHRDMKSPQKQQLQRKDRLLHHLRRRERNPSLADTSIVRSVT